jgi:hypothetical protein
MVLEWLSPCNHTPSSRPYGGALAAEAYFLLSFDFTTLSFFFFQITGSHQIRQTAIHSV